MPVCPCTKPISTSSKTAVRGTSPLGALSFGLRALGVVSSSATTHVGPTSSDCGTRRMSGRPSTSMSSSSEPRSACEAVPASAPRKASSTPWPLTSWPSTGLGQVPVPGARSKALRASPERRLPPSKRRQRLRPSAMPPAKRTADVLRRSVPRMTFAVRVQDLERGPRPAAQVDGRHEGQARRAGRVLEDQAGRQDLEVGDLGQGGQDLLGLLLHRFGAPGQACVHVTDGHGAVVGGVGAHERTAAGAADQAPAAQELHPGLARPG